MSLVVEKEGPRRARAMSTIRSVINRLESEILKLADRPFPFRTVLVSLVAYSSGNTRRRRHMCKAGFQGSAARCWLKDEVPTTEPGDFYI